LFPKRSQICKEDEVINPKTNRCIKIASYLYKKLIKEGILNPDAKKSNDKKSSDKKSSDKKSSDKKSSDKKSSEKSRRNCKNDDTFLMFESIKDIPDSDFIQTADGYCFSATELFAYVNDSNFQNKNPHLPITLFKKQEIDTLLKDHPDLLNKVKEYFEKQILTQNKNNEVFVKTIDVLYMVGNAGRTCYFNNLVSHEREDSSFFQRSIESLQELTEKIGKLKLSTEKSAYKDVSTLVETANKGEMCIHGVGSRLINLFISYFLRLKSVKYDPLKAGIFFHNSPKGILMCSIDHRFSLIDTWPELHSKLKVMKYLKPDMITKRQEKSKEYQQLCKYDSYLVTENKLSEWNDLSDWRKIRFGTDMCFDVLYLVKIMTDNLNDTKNNNPDPKFPTNPFTQNHFTQNEIKLLKYTLEDNFITVNPALEAFISDPFFWIDSAKWKNRLKSKLSKKNRFVRLNNIIDGKLHCNGMWKLKSTQINDVEREIMSFLNTGSMSSLKLLIKKPTETVPQRYYYNIINLLSPKHFLYHD